MWRYITIVMRCGSCFDADPQLPWATAVLTDTNIAGRLARGTALYERAVTHSATIDGEGGEHWHAAARLCKRAERHGFETETRDPLLDDLADILALVHPGKFDALGKAVVVELIDAAQAAAAHYAMPARESVAAHAVAGFVLGSGYLDDPLYPELRIALASDGDEATRREHFITAIHAGLMDRLESDVPAIRAAA